MQGDRAAAGFSAPGLAEDLQERPPFPPKSGERSRGKGGTLRGERRSDAVVLGSRASSSAREERQQRAERRPDERAIGALGGAERAPAGQPFGRRRTRASSRGGGGRRT